MHLIVIYLNTKLKADNALSLFRWHTALGLWCLSIFKSINLEQCCLSQ